METLGKRIFIAHKTLESKLGRNVSFEEYGKLIAKRQGRTKNGKAYPYSAGNVHRWESDKKRPSLEAISAIAELSGMREAFVAFGELPQYAGNGDSGEASHPQPLPPEPLKPLRTARRGMDSPSERESVAPASRRERRGR